MNLAERVKNIGSINLLLISFALVKIILHLVFPEYGFHRDELYYLVISEHFTFNNLEILPVTPLYLKIITAVFGTSIKAVHLASALCGAGIIVFAGLMAKELGGGRSAVFLTCLTALFSGYLIFGAMMTYDSPDFLLWSAAIYVLIRIVKYDTPKLWLVFGVLMAIGLLNKLSILLFGAAVVLSLLPGKQIRNFRSVYLWIGGAIAFLAIIPFVVWQLKTDWYYIDFLRNYGGGSSYDVSFTEYLWNQFLPNNPSNSIIWITGLVSLLFHQAFRKYRFLGYAYLILFVACFFLGTKFYFILPFYTVLLAAGSVRIAEFLKKKITNYRRYKIAGTSFIALYVILSSFLVPMYMPVLKVEKLVDYVKLFGVDAGVKYENTELNVLPQHFADRFGWTEMTAMLANTYSSVRNETGKDVGVIADNWGQASAIAVLGKEYGLPVPISADGWFYLHTLNEHEFVSDYISVGVDSTVLAPIFSDIRRMVEFSHRYGIPHENGKIIYFCSDPRVDLRDYWVQLRMR